MKEIELIIILCQYCFGGEYGIEKFTDRFNRYFKKDLSAQTLLFEISKFKNVDPANNRDNNLPEYARIFKEYTDSEKKGELKRIYQSFKKEKFVSTVECLEEDAKTQLAIKSASEGKQIFIDHPEEKPQGYEKAGRDAYKRRREVAENALAFANYECEVSCNTELFKRKNCDVAYTEAHHLIPLCYQSSFLYSLDVEANVVSLCPNCHRRLHYGENIEPILKKLYKERIGRLKKCGLDISYEELLLLYR